MFINNDIDEYLNKFLDLNSILLLRQTSKNNNFKILENLKIIRNININDKIVFNDDKYFQRCVFTERSLFVIFEYEVIANLP